MVLKFKERLNSKSAKHKTKIQEYKQLYQELVKENQTLKTINESALDDSRIIDNSKIINNSQIEDSSHLQDDTNLDMTQECDKTVGKDVSLISQDLLDYSLYPE